MQASSFKTGDQAPPSFGRALCKYYVSAVPRLTTAQEPKARHRGSVKGNGRQPLTAPCPCAHCHLNRTCIGKNRTNIVICELLPSNENGSSPGICLAQLRDVYGDAYSPALGRSTPQFACFLLGASAPRNFVCTPQFACISSGELLDWSSARGGA